MGRVELPHHYKEKPIITLEENESVTLIQTLSIQQIFMQGINVLIPEEGAGIQRAKE